jgi:hypothetical protein
LIVIGVAGSIVRVIVILVVFFVVLFLVDGDGDGFRGDERNGLRRDEQRHVGRGRSVGREGLGHRRGLGVHLEGLGGLDGGFRDRLDEHVDVGLAQLSRHILVAPSVFRKVEWGIVSHVLSSSPRARRADAATRGLSLWTRGTLPGLVMVSLRAAPTRGTLSAWLNDDWPPRRTRNMS